MKAGAPDRTRLKICIRGAVQGVGFRPFVFRLADQLGLGGWVSNTAQGVFLEVEGPRSELETFLLRLESEKPLHCFIQSLEASWLDAVGYTRFEIRESEPGGSKTALVLPDIGTCPECLREIFDPANRRYFYPFTNCTHCGPRFSIIESLPYDRANTSMKQFSLCPQCQAEYRDPRDRRFHAQPNACPDCGPHLELWRGGPARRERSPAEPPESGEQPRSAGRSHDTLSAAAAAIRAGSIVAVKGLGGFHLMTAAHSEQAVQRLRDLKHREEKPFALMFPSLEAVKRVCDVSPLEERLLNSPEAPIVLLRRRNPSQLSNLKYEIAAGVAPGNPNLGAMLPSTPLHHLLMSLLNCPVVATSGNLTDEPICIDEREALERLSGIADWFLVHNRPIVRHVDDSLVRVMMGREMVLRRARGYAPLPVQIQNAECGMQKKRPAPPGAGATILAVGAHLKNAVALAVGSQVFMSQHIGDLETDQAFEAFRRVIADFEKLYDTTPSIVAADAHPDYLSTRFAQELAGQRGRKPFGVPPSGGGMSGEPAEAGTPNSQAENLGYVSVQHHIAHVLSCMAENELEPPVLGVSWDGTGYGLDGTIWGGEFFLVTDASCERVAHLRQFRLPGGDKAVKEPRRTAVGLLYEIFGEAVFEMKSLPPLRGMAGNELSTLRSMLERGINSPVTSSAGRLFDAVAALAGLRQEIRFEGQAAMELEFALEGIETDKAYSLRIADCRSPVEMAGEGAAASSRIPRSASWILDWSSMIEAILADKKSGVPVGEISAKFHNALAEAIVAVARGVGQNRVALSGGCFQNRYLTERTVRRLQAEGFRPYWHQRVPPNDGGIALGQIIAVLREAAIGLAAKGGVVNRQTGGGV
jgi:hydrogenase maturation protein HypF